MGLLGVQVAAAAQKGQAILSTLDLALLAPPPLVEELTQKLLQAQLLQLILETEDKQMWKTKTPGHKKHANLLKYVKKLTYVAQALAVAVLQAHLHHPAVASAVAAAVAAAHLVLPPLAAAVVAHLVQVALQVQALAAPLVQALAALLVHLLLVAALQVVAAQAALHLQAQAAPLLQAQAALPVQVQAAVALLVHHHPVAVVPLHLVVVAHALRLNVRGCVKEQP